jgi:hypothetical protein
MGPKALKLLRLNNCNLIIYNKIKTFWVVLKRVTRSITNFNGYIMLPVTMIE